jgi:L-malate glycosyltransferase
VKILFYNHTGKISGAERVLLLILAGLDRSHFDSVVLCPTDGKLNEMVTRLGVKTADIQPLEARFTIRADRLAKYVASFVRLIRTSRASVINEAPAIVHANSIRAGLVMSAATFGLDVPVVWHVHDLLPRHPLSTLIRLFACVLRRNRIIAVSRAVAQRFEGCLSRAFRGRVQTVHNAVDVERFSPDSQSRKETRRALGLEAKTVVGIVGQLTPRKGQLELIEAFAELARKVPATALLVVGEPLFNRDGEYAKLLARAAARSGVADRIHFLGAREDIPAIMRALDLLVVNSGVEPFGLTIIEAMASGTPVLATAVDGINEIVRHLENGWLVPARDVPALAEALHSLIRAPEQRARLGRAGRLTAEALFSTERFLHEIEDLYRDTVSSGEMPQYGRAKVVQLSAD